MRGTSLGSTPGNGVGTITSTASPGTLLGAGGAAGSTNQSILPYAVGNRSAAATINSTHVTYDSSSGSLRPLLTTEYASAFGTATDNVRLTATTVAGAGATANSLLFAPSLSATLSGGPITIASGSFLYSPTATATGTVSAGLSFGSAEGIIHTSNTLGISGAITGSGGLTINPFAASTVTLSGVSSYTGTTTLLGGLTVFAGSVANDGVTPGAFGQSTSAIVLTVGTTVTKLYSNTAGATLNRDLIVTGNSSPNVTASLGTSGVTTFTMNGTITLNRTLSLEGGGTAAAPLNLNGTISGAGGLTDAFSSVNVLNGNNTYSGGTNIQTGTYAIGVDSTPTTGALGTGTVFFSGAGGVIQSANATAHTVANNIVIVSALSATPASNPTIAGTGALTFTGTLDLNGSHALNVTNSAATTFTGNVINGALTKFGTGLMALNRAAGNTYTGGTTVSAGTLNVNNSSGSGTGSGTVQVLAGSTLSGNFIISGNTAVSGTLSPGNSVGTANFGGSLTLSSATTSALSLELASAGSFDRITVAGAFTLAGTVNITTIGGFVAQAGQTFDLIDWGSITAGTFTVNTAGASTAPGTTWDVSQFPVNGSITVVPEPATYLLCVLGGAALLGVVRRRKAA